MRGTREKARGRGNVKNGRFPDRDFNVCNRTIRERWKGRPPGRRQGHSGDVLQVAEKQRYTEPLTTLLSPFTSERYMFRLRKISFGVVKDRLSGCETPCFKR